MSETVLNLLLSSIDLGGRLREVDPVAAVRMAISMKEIGQITPIEVRGVDQGRYRLVAGAHRTAGALHLEWTHIRAVLFAGSADEARLREIDENLFRRELSPFDQAEFLEERRQVWERVHGAIKRGGDRRSKAQVAPLGEELRTNPSFVRDTAARLNLSRDTVKRAMMRKGHIDATVWDALRGTPAAENGALLDKLRKVDMETQRAVLELARERGCAIDVALKLLRRADAEAVEYPLLRVLMRGWLRASEAERSRIRAFLNMQTEDQS